MMIKPEEARCFYLITIIIAANCRHVIKSTQLIALAKLMYGKNTARY